MSELLRAFLDANCVSKNSAFYTLKNEYVAPNTGIEFGALSPVSLKCKTDTYFLATGWALTESTTSTAGWLNMSESRDVRFQIKNLTNGTTYEFDGPGPRSGKNFNLNNFVTMPQYVLLRPNDLVQAQFTGQIATGVTVTRFFVYVILLGIEYRFPSGKG